MRLSIQITQNFPKERTNLEIKLFQNIRTGVRVGRKFGLIGTLQKTS